MASSRRLEDHFWKNDRENGDSTEAEPTAKRTVPSTPPVLALPVETLAAEGMSNPPDDGSTNSDNMQSTPEAEEYISFAHISPPGTLFIAYYTPLLVWFTSTVSCCSLEHSLRLRVSQFHSHR